MSSISTYQLCKNYRIYAKPSDRLKEAVFKSRQYAYQVEALKDINITIEPGRAVGIIGRNGSGKSTLLQILAGITKPSSGEFKVQGRVSALLELGAGFNPEFTGEENAYLSGSIYGLSRSEMDQRFDDIVEFADIGSFISQPVKTYSSGMFVRLAFSVATVVNPDVLLVDEALSVGDFVFQEKCINRIRTIKEKGKTIIFVSHDLPRVRMLCDEIYWFDQGIVRDHSIGDAVLDRYIDFMRQEVGDFRRDQVTANCSITPSLSDETQPNSGFVLPSNPTQNIYIHDIRILGPDEQECYRFQTGDDLTLEYYYTCVKTIESPCVGIALKRNDEVYVSQISNVGDMYCIERLEGSGRIRMHFPNLKLLKGTYTFSLHILDDQVLIDYEKLEDIKVFSVDTPKNSEGYDRNWGLVLLDHIWDHQRIE